MKRKLIRGAAFALVALLLAGTNVATNSPSASASTPSLITNGGFESPPPGSSPGSIPGWSAYYGVSGSTRSTSAAHDGAYGVTMVDATATASAGLETDRFTVQQGSTYRVAADVKMTTGQPWIYLLFYNAAGTRIGDKNQRFTTVPLGSWTTIALEGVAPAGATKASVLLYSSLSGITTANWDEIAVSKVSTTSWAREDLGVQLTQVTSLRAATATLADGREIAYIPVQGTTCSLSVFDITNDTVLANVAGPPSCKNAWGVAADSLGTVYIGANDGHLYKYTIGGTAFVDLGVPVANGQNIWGLDIDSSGRVFGGSYPSGSLWSFTPSTGAFRDYGQVSPGSAYVRDVAVSGDKVYAGLGTTAAKFVQIDIATGAVSDIPLPAFLAADKLIYDVDARSGKIFVRGSDTKALAAYDITAGTWTGLIDGSVGLEVSPTDAAGNIYFVGADFAVKRYSSSGVLTNLNVFPGAAVRASAIIDYTGGPFSGPTLALTTIRGKIWLYHLASGAVAELAPPITGQPATIATLERGPDDRIYSSALQSGGLSAFDPATSTTHEYPQGVLGQAEGAIAVGDELYLGVYPGAHLMAFDPTQPLSATNPGEFASLEGDLQDRPFAWASQGNQIIAGTVATYGHLGGSIAVIDATSKSVTKYVNIIADESITALTYVGPDLVLGGTSVYGGLGSTPTQSAASLFLFKPSTGALIWSGKPFAGEKAITALKVASDGSIWGVTVGKLLQFDLDSRTVLRTFDIATVEWNALGPVWKSANIEISSTGEMYISAWGNLYAFETTTYRLKHIVAGANHIAAGADGELYYSFNERLWVATPQ
ncbi:carbohydrate binding domain-containing protein [Microbacterium sp. LWO13-1.2]|uniref:carbohydrate binding domain-containing protein n=1 Tax=Microbacterium sp. LWO13-1.2 TaxID=3135262 RepID=UPI0031390F1C